MKCRSVLGGGVKGKVYQVNKNSVATEQGFPIASKQELPIVYDHITW
jgi:hypothetical protein